MVRNCMFILRDTFNIFLVTVKFIIIIYTYQLYTFFNSIHCLLLHVNTFDVEAFVPSVNQLLNVIFKVPTALAV